MEILGTENPEDVSYITQELIDLEYEEETDISSREMVKEVGELRAVIYGHNMHYCYRDGVYSYCYQRGSNPASNINNACGHNNKYVRWSGWDHYSTNRNCSHGSSAHKKIIKFVSRS